jgi:opacity protein-like surface antigen
MARIVQGDGLECPPARANPRANGRDLAGIRIADMGLRWFSRRIQDMKSTLARLTLGFGLLVCALPALAQDSYPYSHQGRPTYDDASEIRLWVGGFIPDLSSGFWRNERDNFTGVRSRDLEDTNFGADFILRLNPYWGLMFGGSYYTGSTTGAYRNFSDDTNSAIRHDTTLDIGSFTVGAVVHFAPGSIVNPYLGAGAGIYDYRLHENGDFIDFSQTTLPIFRSFDTASGTTFGGYALAGLDFRVAHSVSLFVEGRYTMASKDLSGDFSGLGKIDLSGASVNGGVSFHLR